MNSPIHDNQINRFILKPRFKIVVKRSQKAVLEMFKENFNREDNKYYGKIVNHHVVLDIPSEENHLWSPKLHIEVEKQTEDSALVKGLFGPKPQVWTFFMFLHFAVATSFFVFLFIAYSNYTLNKDYDFALLMCILLPLVWIIFYVFGQLGKKKGHKQMLELFDYMEGILKG